METKTAQQKQNQRDLELVKLSLKNAHNFGRIIEKYEAKLLRYVLYFTNLGQEAAEDILQETFIKVFKNLNAFDQKLSFSSWIYRIAHNEAINFIKKSSGKEVLSLESSDEEVASLINILKSSEDVVAQVDQKHLAEKVRQVLKLMREDYREILVLKFLEDYDYTEISDILKKPMGTIGVLISRAKENFKQTAENLKLKF